MLLPALLLALASPTSPSPQSDDRWAVVDLATHRSVDGRWALTIDPSAPDGGGPATYELEHDGVIAWRAELPFTLSEVAVTNAGYAAGVGWPHSARGDGWMHTVSLAPDGCVVLDERLERTPPRGPEQAQRPIFKGLLFDGKRDIFGWRAILADEDRALQTLVLYRISTGERLATVSPDQLAPPGEHEDSYLEQTALLDELGLFVLAWDVQGASFGTAVSLVDGTGTTVWSRTFPRSREGLDDESHRRLDWSGCLLAAGGRAFSLFVPAEKVRVDFEVTSDDQARVMECARTPWEPPSVDERIAADRAPEPSAEPLELETLARLSAGPADMTRGLRPLVRDGRVLLCSRDALREIDPLDGSVRFTVELPHRAQPFTSPVLAPGGATFVSVRVPTDAQSFRLHPYVGIDTRGEVTGLFHLDANRDFAFAPDGRSGWAVHGADAQMLVALDVGPPPAYGLLPLDDEALAEWTDTQPDFGDRERITRRPDGRWLRADAVAIDADGTIGVISEDALCLFARDGSPPRQVRVSASYATKLDLAGGWALLHSPNSRTAWLVRITDGALFRVEAPGDTRSWHVGLDEMGGELWWLDDAKLELVRKRLPAPDSLENR